MTNNNPNIFFRKNEYDTLFKVYEKHYNTWVIEADKYFAHIDNWDTFSLMMFGSKYEDTFTSLVNNYQLHPNLVQPINDSCGAFYLPIDELYHFSLFQSEPFFYLSILFAIIFVISIFQKRKSVKTIATILVICGIGGNLINYFIVEKDIIIKVEQSIQDEDCERSIYIAKFQNKYLELNKKEPFRYYGE